MTHPFIESANVYAIAMKQYGYEGQLGCAAITFKSAKMTSLEKSRVFELKVLQNLEHYLVNQAGLPGYGVPRFVRVIVEAAEQTETSQQQRDQLGIADRESVGAEYVSLMLKKLKTGLRKEGTF